MFVVTVVRKGRTRKTPFADRDHAQRYADGIRTMPGSSRSDADEVSKVSEEEYAAVLQAKRR